jgi:hypothetical protein
MDNKVRASLSTDSRAGMGPDQTNAGRHPVKHRSTSVATAVGLDCLQLCARLARLMLLESCALEAVRHGCCQWVGYAMAASANAALHVAVTWRLPPGWRAQRTLAAPDAALGLYSICRIPSACQAIHNLNYSGEGRHRYGTANSQWQATHTAYTTSRLLSHKLLRPRSKRPGTPSLAKTLLTSAAIFTLVHSSPLMTAGERATGKWLGLIGFEHNHRIGAARHSTVAASIAHAL